MRGRVHAVRIVVATALLSFPFAGGAAAETGWAVPGSVYVEMGGGVEWVDLPELSVGTSAGGSFAGTDDEFDRWTTELALGYADPDGLSLPDPIGRNARIELRVRYAHGTSESQARVGSATLPYINIPVGALFLDVDALFNSMLETWDADLTYQTDVAVTDWFAISPLVGLTYTRMRFENDYKFKAVATPSVLELNDRTRTHYYGGVLGVDFSARPVETFELTLGLRGDVMGASASMEARQDTFSLGQLHETDNDTNFAGRASATIGATLYLGPLALGVEGFARYLSYLAAPDHPDMIGDRASNIDGEDMWSAGARASLTIWFP